MKLFFHSQQGATPLVNCYIIFPFRGKEIIGMAILLLTGCDRGVVRVRELFVYNFHSVFPVHDSCHVKDA